MTRLFLLLATGLILVSVTACDSPVSGEVNDPEKDPKSKTEVEVRIPVEAGLPTHRDIAAYFETTSRIMAEERVEVISKGMGECLEVMVEEGDKVKEGQVLAKLDRDELEAQIQQTRVSVEMNKYQLDKAREQSDRGILSPFEADNAKFAYDQAVATLKLQQFQLENQTILAPIDGVITQRAIQRGMMVANGMPAFSIVNPDSYVLPITPPEKELRNLKEGQKANVTVDSAPGEEFEAVVRRISPAVDPASGTVRVLLDFNEADKEKLKDSAFARVKLVMDIRENALAIEKDSMLEENGRSYVMVVENADKPEAVEQEQVEAAQPAETPGTDKPALVARKVEIETGLEDSEYVEVVSGIDENTLLVTLGQHTLKPGSPVELTNLRDAVLANVNMTAEEALARAKEQRFKIEPKEDRREKMLR
ncbi:MAG: efflux RND transporter periplasmic adaptor subunit [Candidatus Hydrogenedens sp.]|nr:efflux RND transporter periplasmic adaptor subunit [Candidatus Hydrogenedens sp.]